MTVTLDPLPVVIVRTDPLILHSSLPINEVVIKRNGRLFKLKNLLTQLVYKFIYVHRYVIKLNL